MHLNEQKQNWLSVCKCNIVKTLGNKCIKDELFVPHCFALFEKNVLTFFNCLRHTTVPSNF